MNQSTTLQKKIGFWAATAIIIGSVIGSGVFMKPSAMAAQLGSPILLTIIWIVAGLFSFLGALIYAELGAMMPETGGLYYYFRKMFGDFFGYLYGWSAFSVINTAAVAAIAFVCAAYANHFLHLPSFDQATVHSLVWHLPFIGDLYPLENFGVKSLAIALVMIFTWLNYRSVKAGSQFQVLSTFIKIIVLAALVFGIFFSGKGTLENFWHTDHPKSGNDLISGIIVAMTGAFFAYDGWINITFIAGEVRQPQKNIPKSLWWGVVTCIIVYVLVNQAFLYVLPVETIAISPLVASDAISVGWGANGASIIAALIVVCTLGAINGNIMSVCRVTYAMGKDRLFFTSTGKEHKKYNTPGNALWLHSIWTSVLIVSGSFDMLADMMVFITWISYMCGAIGVIVLRKRMPLAERPYKIWGHPWVTFLFIGFSAFFLVLTIRNDVANYVQGKQPVINSLLGLLIVAIGIPFYFYFRRGKKK
jgi:basic amino acid/polyamine antiporter, APA family